MEPKSGWFAIGEYRGLRQVKRKDETLVPNLFEVAVARPGIDEDEIMKASFFDVEYGGGQSAVAQQLAKLGLVGGERVVVRTRARASASGDVRAFLNYTALAIYRVDEFDVGRERKDVK